MRRLWFLVFAALSCRRANHVTRIPPLVPVVSTWKAEPGALPLDAVFEVTIDDPQVASGRRRASLLVTDERGRRLAPPAVFETSGGTSHVVTAYRAWSPWAGVSRVWVVRGRGDVARITATLPVEVDIARAFRARGFAVDAVPIDPPRSEPKIEPDTLDTAGAWLGNAEPRAIVERIDALRGVVPREHAARADAIAAEAAFAWGRTHLAHELAVRGLAGNPDLATERRLLRTKIASLAEAVLPFEAYAARLSAIAVTEESLLDAALALRLAEIHDRNQGGPRQAGAASDAFAKLARATDASQVAPVSAMLCRAGSHLAGKERDEALARGTQLSGARTADLAMCLIRTGDAAFDANELDRAEAMYERARTLLGTKLFPREQREAWFSAAYLAEARGQPKLAFARASEACGWVDQLLAVERDLGARESLLGNVLGYFGISERFGIVGGEASAAIALGEWGKGRAFGILAAFGGVVDTSAHGSWFAMSGAGSEVDVANVPLDAYLAPDEIALAYTLLGRNDKGVAELAIGAVAKDGTDARIVPVPDDLPALVEAHAEAIERSDDARAREIGAKLHAILIAPIADRLVSKRRILVSPHLRLHRVAFAALHDGTSWLVERFELARIPPLPFYRGRRAAAPHAWLTAIAPPHPPLGALPGFEAIADDLVARIHPAIDLRGTAITPRRALDALGKSDALFYAGHAEYVPGAPLQSALLVSSGEIRAADVLRMRTPLEAVILVGCETARLVKGRASFSDDAMGLPRAFLAAGARSVLGANGPVLDRDAEDFARALLSAPLDDLATRVAETQRCLIAGKCPSRGIATWASYLVDLR